MQGTAHYNSRVPPTRAHVHRCVCRCCKLACVEQHAQHKHTNTMHSRDESSSQSMLQALCMPLWKAPAAVPVQLDIFIACTMSTQASTEIQHAASCNAQQQSADEPTRVWACKRVHPQMLFNTVHLTTPSAQTSATMHRLPQKTNQILVKFINAMQCVSHLQRPLYSSTADAGVCVRLAVSRTQTAANTPDTPQTHLAQPIQASLCCTLCRV
jgi:hypothetical protein